MSHVTQILNAVDQGDPKATEQLLLLVYVDLDSAAISVAQPPDDLIVLDEALAKLAQKHPDKAALVKLRYFAVLTIDQSAQILGMSASTADRHWTYARAWLYRQVAGDAEL